METPLSSNRKNRGILSPRAPEFQPLATPNHAQLASPGYFSENHDVVQLLDAIIFTPSQGICTPSPLPSNFVWLRPTAVLPHSPLGVLHHWRSSAGHGFSNLGPLHVNPQLYYECNPGHEEEKVSYNVLQLPAGTENAGTSKSDQTDVRKRSKTRNSKRRDTSAKSQSGLSAGNGDAVENAAPVVDDQLLRAAAADWCLAHNIPGEASSSESMLDFASLLIAYSIPPKDIVDIGSATAAHHLMRLNARQRRTVKRAYGRAMQALKEV